MAGFTRTNGDLQPVVVYDSGIGASGAGFNNGVNAVISGATVQPQGPKLGFGTVTFTGAATPTGAALVTAIQTIQQLATVYMYEFTEVGANTDTLAVAIYPHDAWDFADGGNLDVALTAALGYAVTTAASVTFSN